MACKTKGALDKKAPKAPKSPLNKPSNKKPDAMRGTMVKKGGK